MAGQPRKNHIALFSEVQIRVFADQLADQRGGQHLPCDGELRQPRRLDDRSRLRGGGGAQLARLDTHRELRRRFLRFLDRDAAAHGRGRASERRDETARGRAELDAAVEPDELMPLPYCAPAGGLACGDKHGVGAVLKGCGLHRLARAYPAGTHPV